MALALGAISSACSSGSVGSTGTGGTSGSGGAAAAASCSNVSPCGGNVVGSWSVTSSCLKLSGNLDISALGLGCAAATITGSLNVTGTWSANANGTYSDDTATSGDAQLAVPAACLMISGTTTTCDGLSGPLAAAGFASVTCTPVAAGGCTCAATIQESGGIGWLTSDPQTSGNYVVANNVLTADGATKYSYCVAGSQMTWTPASTKWTTTGTILFHGNGTSAGTGGSSGTGGTSGTIGTGGMTGTIGTGGTGVGMGGRTGGGGTGVGGRPGTGGATDAGGSTATVTGPCDIYAPATPCVAAYSPVRRLLSTYTGPLYQVRKGGGAMNTGVGGTTMDIGMVAGGYGDSATQDAFCGTDTCTFSIIYDQSGRGNHLKVAPAGCYVDGSANTPDFESSAKTRSLTIGGHRVYALYMNAHEGYRNNVTNGMPVRATPQGLYEIADGKHFGTACCWDFGNASTDNCNGNTMNTIFFGTGFWGRGAGAGPWFMGDFEGGVWSGGSINTATPSATNDLTPTNPSMAVDYAFGILKTSVPNLYAIRTANAQTGGLTTAYDGVGPKTWSNAGGIILGIGGDNSNHSFGTFFEGAITAGRPSDAIDATVLQNVQAAGYGK
jgi:Alpha-L-arabinofuranosidase B, catalytic